MNVSMSLIKEFEELYAEKTIYAVLSFLFICFMNLLCFFTGMFVITADFNRHPDALSGFISFCMIFANMLIISIASIKKYRKTLIASGVANLLILASLIMSFYPQMASYVISTNLVMLTDYLTPFSARNMNSDLIGQIIWTALLLISSVYCFIRAARIKSGKGRVCKNYKRKLTITTAVFFVIAVFSCLIYPASYEYAREYPTWFRVYNNFISEESEQIFNEIYLNEPYENVSKLLENEGYVTTEDYRNSLDRITAKQFDSNLRDFDFVEGYEIWFCPEKEISGNGFVGIRHDGNTVTGIAIGNTVKDMYSKKYRYSYFGYSDMGKIENETELTDYFDSLEKGDFEAELVNKFSEDYGTVYAKHVYLEDGKTKSYYRIYCGISDENEGAYRPKTNYATELLFADGELEYGALYKEEKPAGVPEKVIK